MICVMDRFHDNLHVTNTPGNINVNKRPRVRRADGTVSTVRSISVGTDRNTTLIPTVIPSPSFFPHRTGPAIVGSNAQAINRFQHTGQNLGSFVNQADADFYAQQLHLQQARQLTPAQEARAQAKAQQMRQAIHRMAQLPPNPARLDDPGVYAHNMLQQAHPGGSALHPGNLVKGWGSVVGDLVSPLKQFIQHPGLSTGAQAAMSFPLPLRAGGGWAVTAQERGLANAWAQKGAAEGPVDLPLKYLLPNSTRSGLRMQIVNQKGADTSVPMLPRQQLIPIESHQGPRGLLAPQLKPAAHVQHEIGPRKVGGIYQSGTGPLYRVLKIEQVGSDWAITVQHLDHTGKDVGMHPVRHRTPWDPQRDQVIEEP